MNSLRIFSDTRLSPENFEKLREGIHPHVLVTPEKPMDSLLSSTVSDPAFASADIAFGQPHLADLEASVNLRWLQVSTAGFTRYDTAEFREMAKRRGWIVTNSSSVYAEGCAQHVLAFMLAQARRLPEALCTRVSNTDPQWQRLRHECRLLGAQRVVIVGYGGIAVRLIELLRPFGMEITAMRRTPRGDETVQVVTHTRLPEVLAGADHVINILPENADSRDFFDAARFASVKPGAVFYNIGRGATVDQQALYAALAGGHLSAAWLDVTEPEPLPEDHPLWTLENCHITPHTAGGSVDEAERLVDHFLQNFARFQHGEPLKDRVM